MSSYNNTNFDNLLLQNLMGNLQIRPPLNPFLSQSIEDLLFSSDDEEQHYNHNHSSNSKTQLAKEESKLEKSIIKAISSGNTQSLNPNSGQAVTIGEHHICVGFHVETGSEYRVWEWHGHMMLFDDEDGYSPEYIYGNYFERLPEAKSGAKSVVKEKVEEKEEEDEEEEEVVNLGLKELIDAGDSNGGRVLHRGFNSCSPRFI